MNFSLDDVRTKLKPHEIAIEIIRVFTLFWR